MLVKRPPSQVAFLVICKASKDEELVACCEAGFLKSAYANMTSFSSSLFVNGYNPSQIGVLPGVSMKNLPYFSFVDKRLHEEWSVDGLHQFYVPKGIVTHISYYPMDGKGEEIGVLYTSPSGVLFREWRSRNEVEISEINEVEWNSLYELFTAKQMTHRRGISLRYSPEQNILDVH